MSPSIKQLKNFVRWAQKECARIDRMADSPDRAQALKSLLVRVTHFEDETPTEVKQTLFQEGIG